MTSITPIQAATFFLIAFIALLVLAQKGYATIKQQAKPSAMIDLLFLLACLPCCFAATGFIISTFRILIELHTLVK